MNYRIIALVLISLLAACSDPEVRPSADLVLTNGQIYTVTGDSKLVEAVAIRDGRYIAAGSSEEIAGYDAAQSIDLEGKVIWSSNPPGVNKLIGIKFTSSNEDLLKVYRFRSR